MQLKKDRDKRVKSGHPWIFNNELEKVEKCEPGTVIDVCDSNQQFIGRGYYNPHSLISIRLLTRNPFEKINKEFFYKRIMHSWEYRKTIYPQDDSYRLVYSEGDFLPGLIIDKYSNHLVIQILTAGMDKWKQTIIQVLQEILNPDCIYERSDSPIRSLEQLEPKSQVLFGKLHTNLTVQLDGIRFQIDIQEGQKTGFFFDHRDNRRSIKKWVMDKTVLDLFCGTGAWSLYAAHYGAKKVIGIDSSESALELANTNSVLNAHSSVCSFILEDAFDGALDLIQKKECFDIVICDPPAFAKSKKHLPVALKGYQNINRLAIQLLKPDGILITSTCSYHVTRELLSDILSKCSSKEKRILQLLRYGTQSMDHPILLTVPETEYLKCMTLKVK